MNANKDKSVPVSCRNRHEVERQLHRVRLLWDVPLDVIKAERVTGAMYALEWFLSGENTRLVTSLMIPKLSSESRSN
jgi:hypothetical protein